MSFSPRFPGHCGVLPLFSLLLPLVGLSMPSVGALEAAEKKIPQVGELDPGTQVPDAGTIQQSIQTPASRGVRDSSRPSVVDDLSVEKNAQPRGESRMKKEQTFVLNGVKVVGNETLPGEEIVAVVKPHVGKEISSTQLQKIASDITQLFVVKGYVTSRCIIPAQRSTDGVVVLQVEENRLGTISMAGKNSYRYDVRLFLQHFHDLIGKIIHLDTLNARLKLLSKLPATRIVPSLRKGKGGTSDLLLNISDLDDVNVLAYNNRGSRFTGNHVTTYQGALYNITGDGDWLSLAVTANLQHLDRLAAIDLGYVWPFRERGGNVRAGFSFTNYRLDPEMVGQNVIYEGDSLALRLRYEEPFWVDKGDFWWSAGVEEKIVSSDTVFNTYFDADHGAGSPLVEGEDVLFVGDLSLRANMTDDFFDGYKAANTASAKVQHAFDGLFGSMTDQDIAWKKENVSHAGTLPIKGPIGNVEGMDPSFWKYYLSLSRLQILPFHLTGKFTLEAEYTHSRKIPGSYNFGGADGGVSGYRYDFSLQRPLLGQNLSATVGYKNAVAYSFFRDLDHACGGANTARGRNRCEAGTGYLGLSFSYEKLFGDLTYYNNVEPFEQSQENLKFNIGARW